MSLFPTNGIQLIKCRKAERLQPVLVPSPDELMKAHPVSTRVNSYKNDDAELIKLVSAQETEADPRQLGFPHSENLPQNDPEHQADDS